MDWDAITWSISVSTKWNIGNHKLDFQSTKVLKLSTVFGNLIIIPHYNFNYFCGLEYYLCFFWLISDSISWIPGQSEPDCQFNCDNIMEQNLWQILYDHNSLYVLLTIISTNANWVGYFLHRSHRPVRCGPASRFKLCWNHRFHCLLGQKSWHLLANIEHHIKKLFCRTTRLAEHIFIIS